MPRARKLFLWCAMFFAVAVVLEIVSFLGLSVIHREWMSYRRLETMRNRVQVVRPMPSAEDAEAGGDAARFAAGYVAHPFVGAVLDRSFITAERLLLGGPEAIDFGFHLVEPGIFRPPQPGQLVVALTGGSAANIFAAQGVPRLRRELAAALDEVDGVSVINVALPGYKQPQQLMTLAYLLALGARFDAVINLDGFNDIALAPAETVPKHVFPFYPRSWAYHAMSLDAGQGSLAGELLYIRGVRAKRATLVGRAPVRYIMTATVVWKLLDLPLARRQQAIESCLRSLQPSAENFAARGPSRHYASVSAMYSDLAEVWARCSILMHHLCAGHGVSYHHFLQPNQYVAGSKPMGAAERQVALGGKNVSAEHAAQGYPYLIQRTEVLTAAGVQNS